VSYLAKAQVFTDEETIYSMRLVMLPHDDMDKLFPSVTIRIEKWCAAAVTSGQASVWTHPSPVSVEPQRERAVSVLSVMER